MEEVRHTPLPDSLLKQAHDFVLNKGWTGLASHTIVPNMIAEFAQSQLSSLQEQLQSVNNQLIAARQTKDIECKFRDDMIEQIRKDYDISLESGHKQALQITSLTTELSRLKEDNDRLREAFRNFMTDIEGEDLRYPLSSHAKEALEAAQSALQLKQEGE